MDVISMHQAGFTNAVASLGTALTPGHAALIKRYVNEVYLTYDSDEAGTKAALRAGPILREVGITAKIIRMEPYKDPDEFIKNLGAEAFEERIQKARNGFMFSLEILERDYDTLEHMIYESCLVKGGVVERDPKEQGERALLNFGHTIGHSVEKLKDFKWLHGECVALGMVAAAAISMHRGLISDETCRDIREVLTTFRLPVQVEGLKPEDILSATKSDKKMDGGRVKFILLQSPGNAFIDRGVSDDEILEGIGACL